MFAPDTSILIADDDPIIAGFLTRILALMGRTAVVVSDGAQAIEVARTLQGTLDCAILDVMMPQVNGVDAAAAIRQIIPALPILFISGFVSTELLQRSRAMLGVTFLQKPFTLPELRSRLTQILEPKACGTRC